MARLSARACLAVGLSGCGEDSSAAAPSYAAAIADGSGGSGPAADGAPVDAKDNSACVQTADCAESAAGPWCNPLTNLCQAKPLGHQIGLGDSSPGSVQIATLFTPKTPFEATDLQFHPERFELWVVNRPFEVKGLCTENNPSSGRCKSLVGTTTILFDPGMSS